MVIRFSSQAERYYAEAISLPLYPLLSDEQQDYVVEQMRQLIEIIQPLRRVGNV